MVRYWMHNNMITINGQKMGKSLGNFITLDEFFTGSNKLLTQAYSAMTIRFFILQAHYRSTVDFSNEALQAAEKGLERMMEGVKNLERITPSKTTSGIEPAGLREKCYEAMNDDFNTPIVISHLFDAIRMINTVIDKKATISADDLVLSMASVLWGNVLLLRLCALLPGWLLHIGVWVAMTLAVLDQLGAALAVNRYAASHPRLEQLNLELEKHSDKLRQRLIAHVEKRIQRAYPAIVQPEPTVQKEKALSFGDLVWLFVIGAFLGDVVETLFCRVTAGVWMSRSSLVWGPFSVVWGLALVMAAVLLRGSEERSDRSIFLFGFVMGGAYEYICSAVGELLFGVIFWDYSGFKFNLGGRVNLLYCFFWGIAAVVWIRYGYPLVAKLMANLKKHILPWMTVVLTVFMAVNMGLSALALARYDARTSGLAPANQLDVFLDEHFDNARMERVYPNAKKTG